MGRHKGSYRYAEVTVAAPERPVQRGPLALEGTAGGGARVRLPCRRAELEQAVADLLAELGWLEELELPGARPRPDPPDRLKASEAHGVFDVRRTHERQVWAHGRLDRVVPRDRLPQHRPFGTYPDLDAA